MWKRSTSEDKGIGELNVKGIRMKDANGFYLDISTPDKELPQDVTVIRMNVDDFDEAAKFLKDHGFEPVPISVAEEAYMRATVFKSPSGFEINLIQHKKKKNQS